MGGEVRRGWTTSGQVRGSIKYLEATVKCEYDMNELVNIEEKLKPQLSPISF